MAWLTGGKKFGQYTYDHWYDNDDEEELTPNCNIDEPLPDTLELTEPKDKDK